MTEPSTSLGPLLFEDVSGETEDPETSCLLCDDRFNLRLAFKLFLKHCFEVHNLVIEDVQNIENLHEYVLYWKEKFELKPFESVIPSIKMDDNNQRYYLLSDLLREDKELRHRLRLNHVLKVQEFERTDTSFKRICLFCKVEVEGLRKEYLDHLSEKHNLMLGYPQNLVFVDDLINEIEEKLTNFLCIYCEKKFPDRAVLKEHMRKKMHKCLNPRNKNYDKYCIVNYLEIDKKRNDFDRDENIALERDENSDTEYSDWNEKDYQIFCLFCTYKNTNVDHLQSHMKSEHSFDFKAVTEQLDFYQKVKLVNYIRRQIYNFHCVNCNESFPNDTENKSHMVKENHMQIPELKVFDQPEYFFPTYENDTLLYYLEDIDN